MIEYQTIKVSAPLNRVFKPINETRRRYCVLKGSAGSGKSTNIAIKLIKRLSDPRQKGRNLMCVRKVEATNRDSTLAELKKAIKQLYKDRAEDVWQFPTSRSSVMYCKCKITGAEIIFRGCNNGEDIEKLKSVNFENGKLTDVWIEEATELRETDFDIIDDRLRGVLPEGLFYQIHLTFNPVSATHWIKRRFFDYDDADCMTSHSTYRDNRFIDEAYYRRMEKRRELDPEGYRVYGLGEWGNLGGTILENWKVLDFDPALFNKRYYGQDFGYNHANVLLDVAFKEDDIYICREMYEFEKDTSELIQQAINEGWSKRIEMFCDSAEPDRIKMWVKAGFNAKPVTKGQGSVKAQIDWLKGNISKDKVCKRRIFIHPSCINTIKEITQWRWKLDTKTNTYLDEPVDVFDDAMAALRYSIERCRKPPAKFSF